MYVYMYVCMSMYVFVNIHVQVHTYIYVRASHVHTSGSDGAYSCCKVGGEDCSKSHSRPACHVLSCSIVWCMVCGEVSVGVYGERNEKKGGEGRLKKV